MIDVRVRVSGALPFEATDPDTGEEFTCHCVRVTEPTDMLFVSSWLWERIRERVLKAAPGRSLSDVMAGVNHDCDLWRGPGRWDWGRK